MQIVLACLLVMPLALAASPVELALQSYTPAPAQPGDLLDVFIQVSNNGDENAENVEIQVLETGPFSPEGTPTVRAGTIRSQQVYLARFKVRVDAQTQAGDRLLALRARQDGTEWQDQTVSITVQSDEAALFINDVTTTPATLLPGQEAELEIGIENTADSRLREISVELDLEETPFIALGGGTRKQVASLAAYGRGSVPFTLQVNPATTADIYSVPVTLKFLDDQGNEETIEDNIGLRVNTPTRMRAYLDDVVRSAEGADVTVRIVNQGLSEVKFVEVSSEDGDGYHITAQDQQQYLGNIDSDDWETLRLTVETEREEFELPITYTFQDAFNEEIEQTQVFTVELPPAEQQSIFGASTIIIVLLIVVIVVLLVRRRKKK